MKTFQERATFVLVIGAFVCLGIVVNGRQAIKQSQRQGVYVAAARQDIADVRNAIKEARDAIADLDWQLRRVEMSLPDLPPTTGPVVVLDPMTTASLKALEPKR